MTKKTTWQSFKAEGANVAGKLRALLQKGNLRRVVIEHEGRTVAEFPLTAGVIGALAAPLLAAVGACVALLKDCTIHMEVATANSKPRSAEPGDHAPVDTQC